MPCSWRRKATGRDPGVDGDQGFLVKHVDQVTVPPHPHSRAFVHAQRQGIECALDLDVAVGVDRAHAAGEKRERLWRQRTQSRLIGFQKMGPHLPARGAVDP